VKPKIIRVPPYQPLMTWSVGNNGIPFMVFERHRLPELVEALERFVLDGGRNAAPFLV